MKKIFVILLSFFGIVSLASAAPSGSANYYFKEKHIKNYVNNCIEYWFYPEHNHANLKTLAKAIRKEIKANPDSYEWNWDTFTYETRYSREYVEQLLRGAIIEHIKNRSYSIALEMTGSIYYAQEITKLVDQELFRICSASYELGQGVFAGLSGVYLKQYIASLYDYLRYPYTYMSYPTC